MDAIKRNGICTIHISPNFPQQNSDISQNNEHSQPISMIVLRTLYVLLVMQKHKYLFYLFFIVMHYLSSLNFSTSVSMTGNNCI